METAFNILVVILSIFLAIFLILGITILVYALKLAKAARRIGDKAELAADDAKEFMHGIKGAIAPAVAAKLISSALKNFTKKSKVKVKK
jgi:uncharacterized metal-binding protein